jgi:DNA-binding MarR family transcriptional regulator
MGSNIFSPQPTNGDVGAALGAIRRLVRVLRLGDADAERLTGVSSAQLFVLQQLAEQEASSINELAERTLTDQSSVSTVVSRLAQRGLVKRTPSPADARRMTVSIARPGLELLRRAPVTVQHRLLAALESLPSESINKLTQELNHIVASLGATQEPFTFFFEDDATGAP